jgi:hypothetical protein
VCFGLGFGVWGVGISLIVPCNILLLFGFFRNFDVFPEKDKKALAGSG